MDWLTSKGVKNIQKFLRLDNYYWQFIKDFISIARPLYDLITELMLAALDLDKKMRIKVNISDYVIEEVLSMEYNNRQ